MGLLWTRLTKLDNVNINPPSGPGAEIGDGMTNTTAILNDCPTAPAAKACGDYSVTVNNITYDDWFLPSIKELNEIYENKAAINTAMQQNSGVALSELYYWSSTEFINDNAWGQYFGNGFQFGYDKGYTFIVRAVRAF